MKIRNGFVSNSSSSSFVLALPQESKDSIEDVIFGKMQIPETSLIFSIAKDMAKAFANSCDEELDIDAEIKDTEKYTTSDGKNWAAEWIRNLETYKEKGWSVFRGGFANDNTEIETMLCYLSLKIEDEDLHFDNSGGY